MNRLKNHLQSLLAQSLLRIVVPVGVVMFGVVLASVIAYQRTVTSLLLDRDRQIATLSATRVSHSLDEYALFLEAFAERYQGTEGAWLVPGTKIILPSELFEIFNAGIVLVDAEGITLGNAPFGYEPVGQNVLGQNWFTSLSQNVMPQFSDVLADSRTGQDMILVAVPILDAQGEFGGALLGAIHLHTATLGATVRRLVVGDEGFGYLVDSEGIVIFHPDGNMIGTDVSDRPFISQVSAGESGGMLWSDSTDRRVVLGFAPVGDKGWGLIVREPWDDLVQPARLYGLIIGLVAAVALALMAYVLWQAVKRITAPIQRMGTQISRLASGQSIEPLEQSGIQEMDLLAQTFTQMAAQIASYRAGLRRYLGAITRSQEDERRRIARELHDETIQDMLAISRRLELSISGKGSALDRSAVNEIQKMLDDSLQRVRQITRHLRPLALEDLGLVPSLQALVETTNSDPGVNLRTTFHLIGKTVPIPADQELAIYRIAQEALTNARKHSSASTVQVVLEFHEEAFSLEVQDDGIGFELPTSLTELANMDSFGLMGIQERVWSVGGSLVLDSHPGKGMSLKVVIPLQRDRGTP